MQSYDMVQCDLVIRCEKPHEFGMTGKGATGDILGWMLRDFLREEFKHVNFDMGTVCRADRKGWHKREEYSPQIDIIAYHGDPWEKIYEYVVVPKKNVFLAIEVKKWITYSDIQNKDGRHNVQVNEIKNFLEKPVFLVVYRTAGIEEKLKKMSLANKTYIFSKGRWAGEAYPDYIEDFEKTHLCQGELERLVKDINQFIK